MRNMSTSDETLAKTNNGGKVIKQERPLAYKQHFHRPIQHRWNSPQLFHQKVDKIQSRYYFFWTSSFCPFTQPDSVVLRWDFFFQSVNFEWNHALAHAKLHEMWARATPFAFNQVNITDARKSFHLRIKICVIIQMRVTRMQHADVSIRKRAPAASLF